MSNDTALDFFLVLFLSQLPENLALSISFLTK